MKNAFAALVGVQMLAELVDEEKLLEALRGIPNLAHWSAVREIVEREILRRRQQGYQPTIEGQGSTTNAA